MMFVKKAVIVLMFDVKVCRPLLVVYNWMALKALWPALWTEVPKSANSVNSCLIPLFTHSVSFDMEYGVPGAPYALNVVDPAKALATF